MFNVKGAKMEKGVFEKQLSDLVNEIQSIPTPQRDKLVELVKKTYDCHKRLRKSVDSL